MIEYAATTSQLQNTMADAARRLGVPRGELLLYLLQVDYAEDDLPVLSSHEFHLADAFAFSLVRRGPGRRSP